MTGISETSLPETFSELERFVPRWSLSSNRERYAARTESSMEELREFYNAMLPRIEQALAFLNLKPMTEFDEKELRLLRLCLSLSEVGLAVEVYRAPVLSLAPPANRFVVSSSGLLIE